MYVIQIILAKPLAIIGLYHKSRSEHTYERLEFTQVSHMFVKSLEVSVHLHIGTIAGPVLTLHKKICDNRLWYRHLKVLSRILVGRNCIYTGRAAVTAVPFTAITFVVPAIAVVMVMLTWSMRVGICISLIVHMGVHPFTRSLTKKQYE